MNFNFNINSRALAVFMAMLMIGSIVGMAFAGGAAAAVTAGGDFAGDGTDVVEGFEASDDANSTVTYETTVSTDTTADLEELSLEVAYQNNTVSEYDLDDAEVIAGDDDDTTPLEVEFEINHGDLERLPGDADQATTTDVTITELEDADGAEETTEAFEVDFEFASTHAVVTVFDQDDDALVSLETDDDDDDGLFGFSLSSLNPFGASDLDIHSEIDDDVGVNGTQTDINVYADDNDVIETYDESIDGYDAGDRVGLLMTSSLDGQAIVVFNEEPGEFINGEEADPDEDTYAVYNGDGHTEINLGDDRYDDDDDEVSVNMVSGLDVDTDTLIEDLDYSGWEANGLTFGSAFDSLSGWADSFTDALPFVGSMSVSGGALVAPAA